MYLLVSHIPVFVDGQHYFADVSWQKDLILARDWLASPFGELVLLSPSCPLKDADEKEVNKLVPIASSDGIRVVPSFDYRCRTRQFWLKQRKQWISDLHREVPEADVVHSSATRSILRPLGLLAHEIATKSHATTIFIGPDMAPHISHIDGFNNKLFCLIFDHLMRHAIRTANVTLLKEGIVHKRYGHFGSNVKAFCHSMHSSTDVIGVLQLKDRLLSFRQGRPLRAVYAGRFVARKGLKDAILSIAIASQKGLAVEYHLFGSGPEEQSLRHMVSDLGIDDIVHFHGFIKYDSSFLATLAEFDVLLFMPTSEDTPRMLYDAMAAGLPIVGSNIPFLIHRIETDQVGLLVDIGDSTAAAACLHRLQSAPAELELLSKSAMAAGQRHSIEKWYQRRSEWTQEAVTRKTKQ